MHISRRDCLGLMGAGAALAAAPGGDADRERRMQWWRPQLQDFVKGWP